MSNETSEPAEQPLSTSEMIAALAIGPTVPVEVDNTYKSPTDRTPQPGKYARVRDGVVIEEPVDLPDEPSVFYPSDLGEWVKIEEGQEAHCHWLLGDGTFVAPPPLEIPAVIDPLDQLRALIAKNPGILEQLQQLSPVSSPKVREDKK